MTDKILFWLDSNLIYFGIAKYLQEQYKCKSYAIIEVPSLQKKFFKEQNIIELEKSWFYYDNVVKKKSSPDLNYLSNFEKKYELNLWLLAYNERLFYNHNDFYKFSSNEVLNILEQECKFFEKVLDETKPDFIIMAAPNLHYNYLFHKMCLKRKIKCLILGPSRFGNRCILSEQPDTIDDSFEENNQGPERTRTELMNFLKNDTLYEENNNFKKNFNSSRKERIKASFKFLFSNNKKIKTHYPYFGRTKLKIILKTIGWLIREPYRLSFIDKTLSKNLDNEKFIYFPLQIDIEASILIFAPFYTNQLELVISIMKSLPIGYKLYVKDHPLQNSRGWRSISFYKKIMSLPNVKLLHHSINPDEILERCSAVITISSTAGMEAALYKKPSILLADSLFSNLPSVNKIKNINELPLAINSTLDTEVKISDVNKFVNFIYKNSIKFSLSKFIVDTEEHFYYSGFLVDLQITEEKMNSYLKINETKFQLLVSEHIKKINYFKNTKTDV